MPTPSKAQPSKESIPEKDYTAKFHKQGCIYRPGIAPPSRYSNTAKTSEVLGSSSKHVAGDKKRKVSADKEVFPKQRRISTKERVHLLSAEVKEVVRRFDHLDEHVENSIEKIEWMFQQEAKERELAVKKLLEEICKR